MTEPDPPVARIPIIFVDGSTWESAKIFSLNSWTGTSKGVIQSCWAEFSVLRHCIAQIQALCEARESQCRAQVAEIQEQYRIARFPIERSIVFVEKPELHMRVEAFFSGVKSLLDLLVQLLATEKIVTVAIHGFHRSNDMYGGTVINALRRNARKDHKKLAKTFETLLLDHKSQWIDQLIMARDYLIHPKKGMFQVMFQIDIAESDGKLVCTEIKPPMVASTPIDQYAAKVLQQTIEFTCAFIAHLQADKTEDARSV